MHQKLLKSVDV